MRQPGERLPDGSTVFRGVTKRSWINKDTGELQPAAFFRRQRDEQGLSVSESPRNAVAALQNWGVAPLPVGGIRAATTPEGKRLELDVAANPEDDPRFPDPYHAEILGLPPWAPAEDSSDQEQLDAAVALVRCIRPKVGPPADFPEPE